MVALILVTGKFNYGPTTRRKKQIRKSKIMLVCCFSRRLRRCFLATSKTDVFIYKFVNAFILSCTFMYRKKQPGKVSTNFIVSLTRTKIIKCIKIVRIQYDVEIDH